MKPGNEKFTSSIKFKDLNPFWFQKPALVNKNCSARKGDRTTVENCFQIVISTMETLKLKRIMTVSLKPLFEQNWWNNLVFLSKTVNFKLWFPCKSDLQTLCSRDKGRILQNSAVLICTYMYLYERSSLQQIFAYRRQCV